MLIYEYEGQRRSAGTLLALSEAEAIDLVEKIQHLLKDRAYHHDHVEDYENWVTLGVTIIDGVELSTYMQEVADEIRQLKRG